MINSWVYGNPTVTAKGMHTRHLYYNCHLSPLPLILYQLQPEMRNSWLYGNATIKGCTQDIYITIVVLFSFSPFVWFNIICHIKILQSKIQVVVVILITHFLVVMDLLSFDFGYTLVHIFLVMLLHYLVAITSYSLYYFWVSLFSVYSVVFTA